MLSTTCVSGCAVLGALTEEQLVAFEDAMYGCEDEANRKTVVDKLTKLFAALPAADHTAMRAHLTDWIGGAGPCVDAINEAFSKAAAGEGKPWYKTWKVLLPIGAVAIGGVFLLRR